MQNLGVIPARLQSKRLHHKVLQEIKGYPLVYYTYTQVKRATYLDKVVVATDSNLVKERLVPFGIEVILTSNSLDSGTERVIEAVRYLSDIDRLDIVVNIQADEPLINPEDIDSLIEKLLSIQRESKRSKEAAVYCATLIRRIKKEREFWDSNVVKVVKDKDGLCLYFSRAPIPFISNNFSLIAQRENIYRHIGIYAFRNDFLQRYAQLSPCALEKVENLEQLRILENGYKILAVEARYDSIGVDTEDDLKRVRGIIGEKEL